MNIGTLNFKTKKEAYNYTKKIIYDLGECSIDINNKYYPFFSDLLENHEWKNTKEIKCFIISKSFINCYETSIERVDGSIECFSWNYCCGKSKKDLLTEAMRSSIDIYGWKFKSNTPILTCAICNTNDGDFHTDHKFPFINIKNKFLENRYDIPTKFGKELITNKITLKDSIFKDEWIDFHNINTTCQILCKNCNLKKGKKNIHNKIPMSICLVSIE